MVTALAVSVGSVLLGALLGLVPRVVPWAGAVRTFAMVSAVALVLGRIVPDALVAGGVWVLLVAAAAFLLPAFFERLGQRFAPKGSDSESRWVLEISFLGLLIHKVGDGIGLGTYSSGAHAGHQHWDVFLAIAAHTIPITAVLVGALASNLGRSPAMLRAAVLMAAGAAGVLLSGSLLESVMAPFEPWILAVVGGLLLHVVAHSHPHSHGDEHHHGSKASSGLAPSSTLVHLVAGALGLSVLFLGSGHGEVEAGGIGHGAGVGHVHAGGHAADPALQVAQALLDISLESAPALFWGLVAGAALQLWGAFIPMRWLRGGTTVGQAIRGAAVGIPVPICSCGVLPVVESLRRRGGSAAVVTSFLIAAPELGVETFFLTVRFFGWPFAILRLVAALVVAVVVAVVLTQVLQRFVPATIRGGDPEASSKHGSSTVAESTSGSILKRFLVQFEDLLAHIGPWTLLGLVVAAYASVAVQGAGDVSTGSLAGDVLVVTALAIPSYVCAASATPLAAVLVMEGFSPGAALLGLLLGPATNVATFGYLSKEFGLRSTLVALSALLLVGWAIAAAGQFVLAHGSVLTFPDLHHHSHGWFAQLCFALLVISMLVGIGRRGVGPWFQALTPTGLRSHRHAPETTGQVSDLQGTCCS